jgi:hypothetical protein
MIDLVSLIADYCDLKGFNYRYGNKAVINLIDRTNEYAQGMEGVFWMHEINTEKVLFSTYKSKLGTRNTGSMWLLVKSDMDMTFKEKYENNIVPLRAHIDDFIKQLACTDVEIEDLKILPVTDFLDINTDGWIINYSIVIKL